MEDVMTLILEYITEEAMILVPVLWIVGMILKKLKQFQNKYIPLTLLIIGIGIANLYLGLSVEASLQGILATGLAIFGHQLKKQSQKSD